MIRFITKKNIAWKGSTGFLVLSLFVIVAWFFFFFSKIRDATCVLFLRETTWMGGTAIPRAGLARTFAVMSVVNETFELHPCSTRRIEEGAGWTRVLARICGESAAILKNRSLRGIVRLILHSSPRSQNAGGTDERLLRVQVACFARSADEATVKALLSQQTILSTFILENQRRCRFLWRGHFNYAFMH